MLFGGALFLIVNFSAPMSGFIDVPVSFYLKNRLHLSAPALATFKVWVAIPLFLSFVFGFIRDRWSPFGGGDKAHIMLFAGVTALVYVAMAFIPPSYLVFLAGLILATIAFQIAASAAYGVTNTVAAKHAVTGEMGAILSIAVSAPNLMSYLGGGFISQALEGQKGETAARILFLIAVGLMALLGVAGRFGPRWLFLESRSAKREGASRAELGRLFRHWPIYPALLIQLLWQFAPAIGTVLQYHITGTLHGSDAQWGEWNAIFLGAFIPIYILYVRLCRRYTLRTLLWVGLGIGSLQMAPMLLAHTANGALIAAAGLGLMGGIAQGAVTDLTIRSAPRGLESTMMMFYWAMYYVAVRVGDLVGTWIYAGWGFHTALYATICTTALTLLVIPFIPKGLINTTDAAPARPL